MKRQLVRSSVSALGDDEVEVVMSTAAVARDGHILVPQGCQLNDYRSNPIVLHAHDPDQPIGNAENIVVGRDQITARIRFAPAGVSANADKVRGLVKSGVLRGVSVGFDFDPADAEPLDPKRPRGGLRILAWTLYEISFVAVPADTGALVTARSMHTGGGAPMVDTLAREADQYTAEPSLALGGAIRMLARANGAGRAARANAAELYGERHPITRALAVSAGASGGFFVPDDQMPEVIELLRAQAVVRGAGGRVLSMPRGAMTLPGQASAAAAAYGSEINAIPVSQPGADQIVASYKKLTALVPVSNDMMRYADPTADAFVRDDLIKTLGLREDLAFMLGDGTQDTPRGWTAFANSYAVRSGGSPGMWLTNGNSTAASGGNFITSTEAYTLATVAAELGGAVNRLDAANVPDIKRCWFMHPRSYNFLYNVQNSLGIYVYRPELIEGKLFGYPVKRSTQIGTNYYDATGAQTDCSFVFLVEMTEDLILDSMALRIDVSSEGTYVDANGATVSAFQADQSIVRAIAEHDHQMRHDASVAVIQFVRWAPASS